MILKVPRLFSSSFLSVVLQTIIVQAVSLQAQVASKPSPAPQSSALRHITAKDIVEWKEIKGASLTSDGEWFAYTLAPKRGVEGNSEVIARSIHSTVEYRFKTGGTGRESVHVLSPNSRWLAFTVAPSLEERKDLKKDKKDIRNAVAIFDLRSGKKTEIPDVQRFEFNGERGDWIALTGYSPDSNPDPLVLRQIETEHNVKLENVVEFAFDKPGNHLAWLARKPGKLMDSVELSIKVIDLRSHAVQDLNISNWKGFPKGYEISPDRELAWADDGSGLFLGIRPSVSAEDSNNVTSVDDNQKPMPNLLIWHWNDTRLPTQQIQEAEQDRAFNFLSFVAIKDGRFIPLADSALRSVTMSTSNRYLIGEDNRSYALSSSLDGKEYKDYYLVDRMTGKRVLIIQRSLYEPSVAPDDKTVVYYRDGTGHYYSYDISSSAHRNITQDVPTSFIGDNIGRNIVNPPSQIQAWTANGAHFLIGDGYDVWAIPVRGGNHINRAINLTGNGKTDGISYIYVSPYPKNTKQQLPDLSKPIYFTAANVRTRQSGIARYIPNIPGKAHLDMPVWEDAWIAGRLGLDNYSIIYKGNISKARDANVFIYTRETSVVFPDYYMTDSTFKHSTRLTDANPQQSKFVWSPGSRLVSYVCDGVASDTLKAALLLPAGYERGKSYPTVVHYYEKMSNRLHMYIPPEASMTDTYGIESVPVHNGYAVLLPDIIYKVNDPGRYSAACIISAVKAAIATGVVDSSRMGVTGHSMGGYETLFLISQTSMFKAAVASAALSDIVFLYNQIYGNSGEARSTLFESGQTRFTGPWWENWDAYYRNNPIYFARNVTTPLLMLHNDQDGAVNFQQGVAYFNVLRRMRKPVVMLQYVGENHSLAKKENLDDFGRRMKEFFDYYLKGAPAPKWWTDGVPYLKLGEHLRERQMNN